MSRLASIIIDNYNYGRYLAEAIDSALTQIYPHNEVIVVDDGSTDNSREIIANYGNRISAVLKANGGQASAFNAGFRASHGEIVCFLDADDFFSPTTLHSAAPLFDLAQVVQVHWPLAVIAGDGTRSAEFCPTDGKLPAGDLRPIVISEGPGAYSQVPTSGNAWSRTFLEQVLPIPEDEFRYGADSYLLLLAPLFGHIESLADPQAYYRLHDRNHHHSMNFDGQLAYELANFDHRCRLLEQYCNRLGMAVQPQRWKDQAWVHQIQRSVEHLVRLIPSGDAFILVDFNTWWPGDIAGRRRLPFLERDGQYWGPPLDDEQALQEFERMRRGGAKFIVFAWPCFWWLECYSEFARYLRAHYRSVVPNERLIVFDLRGVIG